jgi:amidase
MTHASLFPFRRFLFALAFVTIAAAAFASPHKFTIEEATIDGIQQAILAKQTTSTEVVKLYLARIKAYNGPAVDEPYGLLGPVKIKAHAKGINALSTLNLRPPPGKPGASMIARPAA